MRYDKIILRIALMRSAFFARMALLIACAAAYAVETFSESRSIAPLITALMLAVLPGVIRYYIREASRRRTGENKTVPCADELPTTLINKYRYSSEASWGDHIGVICGIVFLLLWQMIRCRSISFAFASVFYYGGVQEWLLVIPFLAAMVGAVSYAVVYVVCHTRLKRAILSGSI